MPERLRTEIVDAMDDMLNIPVRYDGHILLTRHRGDEELGGMLVHREECVDADQMNTWTAKLDEFLARDGRM